MARFRICFPLLFLKTYKFIYFNFFQNFQNDYITLRKLNPPPPLFDCSVVAAGLFGLEVSPRDNCFFNICAGDFGSSGGAT